MHDKIGRIVVVGTHISEAGEICGQTSDISVVKDFAVFHENRHVKHGKYLKNEKTERKEGREVRGCGGGL